MSIPYKKVKLFYKPIILLGGHTDDRHFMIKNLMTMLNDLDQIVDGQDYEEDDIVVIPDAPDTVDTEEPVVDIEIVDGRVTRVDVKEGFAFNGLPDLNIESSTGFGAVLRTIM